MWKCPIGFCYLGRRTQAFPLTWGKVALSMNLRAFKDGGVGEDYAGVQEGWVATSLVFVFTARDGLFL